MSCDSGVCQERCHQKPIYFSSLSNQMLLSAWIEINALNKFSVRIPPQLF